MKGKVIISVILIVLLLSIGIYFILQTPQSIIPSQCYLTEKGSTANSYKCPSDASSCVLKLSLDCSTQVSGQQVVFRGSSQQLLPSSIAIDSNNDKALESYVRATATLSSCNSKNIITYLPEPYQSNYVFIYNSKVYICDGTKGILYIQGSGVSTSSTPLSGESCDYSSGFIRCLGDISAYQCSQSVTGSVTKLIIYSGSVPGTKTETITINAGQTIGWAGKIDYEVKKVKQSECTKNVKVSSNSYYKCIIGSDGCGYIDRQVISCGTMLFNEITGECQASTTCTASNGQVLNKGQAVCIDKYTLEKCSTSSPPSIIKTEVTQEGDICMDGVIKPAYVISISISNLAGDSIVAETNSPLKINLAITETSNNKRIPVSASIVGTGISKSGFTGDTSLTAGKILLELTTPNEGFYTLRITVNHPDGTYTKDYELRVTSGLTLNLYADNPIQYDNQKIQVRLDAYKSAENKRLTDYQYEAYFNNQRVYTSFVEPSGKNLILYFTLKGDGTLRIRANGQDETELWSGWTDYTEITVKETTISINTDFKTGVCPGNIENKFTTIDSNGNLIDTQNSVLIQEPLGGKTNLVSPTKISTGSYKFNYNFAEGGLYTIKVTSTSSYGTYELGDGLGEPITILSGSSCSGGGGDEPDTNWLMYIIFGVIIGVIILVIVMIRKKK